MIGYKLFDRNWCSTHGSKDFYDKPFEIGVEYTDPNPPQVSRNGFHFCESLENCFTVYSPDSRNRIGEIEVLGEVHKSGSFCCTNKFKIVREIPWREVIDLI